MIAKKKVSKYGVVGFTGLPPNLVPSTMVGRGREAWDRASSAAGSDALMRCIYAVVAAHKLLWVQERLQRFVLGMVDPSPANHASLTQLKAGDTIHQAGELQKRTKIHDELLKTL